jgi:hypothetical protein
MKLLAATIAMAALCAIVQTAVAQTGTAPFCLQTNTGTRCIFSTMGECEAAKGRTTWPEQCMTRTDAHGTTGLGASPRPIGPPSYPDLPPVKPEDLER